MNFKKISKYDIRIRHTSNGGMIVKVGCAEFSFSNPEDMMDVMKQYYENPDKMEKEYNKVSIQDTDDEAQDEEREPYQENPIEVTRRQGRTRAAIIDSAFDENDINLLE